MRPMRMEFRIVTVRPAAAAADQRRARLKTIDSVE